MPHFFMIIFALVIRFHKLTTSWWTYGTLMVVSILLAAISMELPINDDFFINMGPYDRLSDACTFLSLESAPQHQATFTAAYKDFFGLKNLTLIVSKKEYDLVMDQMNKRDELLAVDGCRISNLVKARFFLHANHFEVSLHHHLFADKLDLRILEGKHYPSSRPEVHPHREAFIRYLLAVMNDAYRTQANLSTIKVEQMDANIKAYYLEVTDMSSRLVFILAIFCSPVWAMSATLRSDLRNGFIDTLLSTNNCHFFYYIFARYCWSLLYALQLVVSVALIALAYFWIHLNYYFDLMVLELIGLCLIYDFHVSYVLIHLLVGRMGATAAFFLNLIGYLLWLTIADSYISSLPYEYPYAVRAFNVLVYFFVPGTLFFSILAQMVDNGQYMENESQFAEYKAYVPINANYHHTVAAMSAYFLFIIITKTVICSTLYRAYWSNLYERKWTLLWSRSSIQIESTHQRFHFDPSVVQQQQQERTFEEKTISSKQSTSGNSTECLVALKFTNVKKRSGDGQFKIDTMTVLYEHVTVLYAAGEQKSSLSIICRLAAGFAKADKGVVQLFPNHNMAAKVAFVVTANLHLSTLTVAEYLRLFCVFQQVPSSVMSSRIADILNFLGMYEQKNIPTDGLSHLNQLKLSTGIALLGQCTALVFDQPTKAVALEDKREFWEILLKLKTVGKAVFLTTNSMEEVDYIADYALIFINGSIQAQGTPDELKRTYQRDDFCLCISKTSLMSRKEIEDFLQKVATEKKGSKQADDRTKSKQGYGCVFKKDSFNEYIFTFKFETDKQKRVMSKVLDALQEKAERGAQIAVNSISRNTLKDSFETIFSSALQKKKDKEPYPIQPNVVWPERPADSHCRVPSSPWTTYCCLFWMRRITTLRWPSWLLIGIISWSAGFLFSLWATYQWILRYNAFTMARRDLTVEWSTVADRINGSLEQEQAAPDSNRALFERYHRWIISQAESFDDFATSYWAAYQLTVDNQSVYHLHYIYNQFSSHPELFDLMAPFTMIVQRELSARQVNFSFDLSYFGHYRECSDLFDSAQAAWVMMHTTSLVTILAIFAFLKDIHQDESGWLQLLRANGLNQWVYVLVQTSTYFVFCCLGFYTTLAFFLFIIGDIHHLAVTLFTFPMQLIFIASLCFIGGFTIFIDILCSGHIVRIALLSSLCLVPLVFTIGLAASSANMHPVLYFTLIILLNILPTGIMTTQFAKEIIPIFLATIEQFDRFVSLLLPYNYYIVNVPDWVNLGAIYAWVGLFFALCCLHTRFMLRRYKAEEQRQVTFVANTKKDDSIAKEYDAVMRALEPQVDSTEQRPLFVVHNLSQHSGQRSLHRVSFLVKRGECFAIYGLRDAGKSRLLEVLAGVQPFEEGDFYLWNEENGFGDTTEDTSQVARFKKMDPTNIAFCPAFNCIDRRLTVFESLLVFAQLRVVPKAQLWSCVHQIATLFQLSSVLSKRGSQLSHYEARLLTLALSFIGNPKLILIDHPSAQVETFQKRSIWSILLNAQAAFNSTIILASNSSAEVEALCDRMAVMIQGTFQFIGPDHQLRAKHCKGFDIMLKVTPARLKESYYMLELNKQMLNAFPRARSMSTHKYILNYNQPDGNISWSIVLARLETLRFRFSLETYTLNMASLNEMFYHYAISKDKEDSKKDTSVKQSAVPRSSSIRGISVVLSSNSGPTDTKTESEPSLTD